MLFGYEVYDVMIVPDGNHLGFYSAKVCMTDMVSKRR